MAYDDRLLGRCLPGHSGSLWRAHAFPYALFLPYTPVGAVCVHCKGFCDGCTGSASCPLGKELTDNSQAMEAPSVAKIPTVGMSLPAEMQCVFNKNVVETIVGIACAPVSGQTIDFTDSSFATSAAFRCRTARSRRWGWSWLRGWRR